MHGICCCFFSHLCAASSSLLSPLHPHLPQLSLAHHFFTSSHFLPLFLPFCFLSFNFLPCPVPSLPICSFTYFPVQLCLLFLHNLPLLSRNTLSFHFLSFASIHVYFLSSHLLTSPARSRSCCLNFLATDPLNRVDVIFGAVHRADGWVKPREIQSGGTQEKKRRGYVCIRWKWHRSPLFCSVSSARSLFTSSFSSWPSTLLHLSAHQNLPSPPPPPTSSYRSLSLSPFLHSLSSGTSFSLP